jgi:flavin-dependent dehydrogenase
MTRFDIAVVGAGLAGLQVARRVAARGLRVVLLDRKASLAEGIHTTGIFVRKTWEDFPLPDEQLGRPIREVVLYSPARRTMHLTADHDEFRVGRMSWLYLYLLEQCSRAGVHWLPSSRLLACEEDGDATQLVIDRHGTRERIRARYVVGADGARSMVAQQLGLDRNQELLTGIEEVVPSRGGVPVMHCFLDPRLAPGYIAWIVDDGEEAHIGVAGYRSGWDPGAALRAFRASVTHLADGRVIERRGGLIPVGGMLRTIANRRGLLVGDAAGAVSPLTAGGFDGAMRLSSFAADVIAEMLSGADAGLKPGLHGAGVGAAEVYSGTRFRARFLTRRWMRHAIRLMSQPPLMEAACALLRTPPLRALAAHVFFARGSFPEISRRPLPTAY